MSYSKDISNKIDPAVARVLIDLAEVTTAHGIPFFVVGATARDIVFGAIHNVPTSRATLDVDLAIRINTWADFDNVVNDLVNLKSYKKDSNQIQRLNSSGTIVDLVPFGPLENPAGSIAWPPSFDIVMKTAGFDEALRNSIDVRISNDPEVIVKVSTPAALAVMKICAWKDNYPRRKKDATDLRYILTKYIDAGNEARLYSSDDDLLAENLDYDLVSARLLGRDAQEICTLATRNTVIGILNEELAKDSVLRLLSDMLSERLSDEQPAEFLFQLLKQFQIGFEEDRNRKEVNS